ncbi:MAG: fibronectin type III-like domain-contianing protein, partial [Promicromonosporaceae bacterium]|nr:fibronectin type III-like domain-contianing protein [Promicromonosporaceae bacterium]
DVLTGAVSPSGCLTSTWAKQYDDLPHAREYSYLKGEIDREFYREGIYVGYRYFDSFAVDPRYEFGHGLTYPDFLIEAINTQIVGTTVTVTARVKNIGIVHSGKKVAQLYVSCPSGELAREYQHLAAFAKTRVLMPGESEELALTFNLTDLAGYHEGHSHWLLESGDYLLRLGHSSRRTEPVATLTLDSLVVVEQCQPICSPKVAVGEMAPPVAVEPAATPLLEHLPRLLIDPAAITTIQHVYTTSTPEPSPKVQAWLDSLTDDEKVSVLLGTGFFAKGAFTVPGAAAVTTADLLDKGIVNVALCDGPAGVRLQRDSVVTRLGAIKPITPMMEVLNHLPFPASKIMLGRPEQGEPRYQFGTAFPVGTAQAQTWNTDLLRRIGDAVGIEMIEYGATFWLAPGINIQRNPLCGRNYEYYSEDPLLTGAMAAAVTKGVQAHDGCYVTVKHFAANNQEQQRNHSDSVMTERTLREIYLRAFATAVRRGGAKSVMTSYNLLNGVYTPNSHDLCTKALRNEWGFTGVVMTDWLATGKGLASNGLAVAAGNDLIMPGGRVYRKMLTADIAAGLVTPEQIDAACLNILTLIAGSHTQAEFEARG